MCHHHHRIGGTFSIFKGLLRVAEADFDEEFIDSLLVLVAQLLESVGVLSRLVTLKALYKLLQKYYELIHFISQSGLYNGLLVLANL